MERGRLVAPEDGRSGTAGNRRKEHTGLDRFGGEEGGRPVGDRAYHGEGLFSCGGGWRFFEVYHGTINPSGLRVITNVMYVNDFSWSLKAARVWRGRQARGGWLLLWTQRGKLLLGRNG